MRVAVHVEGPALVGHTEMPILQLPPVHSLRQVRVPLRSQIYVSGTIQIDAGMRFIARILCFYIVRWYDGHLIIPVVRSRWSVLRLRGMARWFLSALV